MKTVLAKIYLQDWTALDKLNKNYQSDQIAQAER